MILAVAYSEESPRTNSTRWSWLSFLVSPCRVVTTGNASGQESYENSRRYARNSHLNHFRLRNQLLNSLRSAKNSATTIASGEQTAFHTIAAAAPEHAHFPLQGVPGHPHCKPAQVASEQGKSHVPAEMQPYREPQSSSTPHRVSQQDSPRHGVHDSHKRDIRIPGMHQSEDHAGGKDGRKRAHRTDQQLERIPAEQQLFSHRSEENRQTVKGKRRPGMFHAAAPDRWKFAILSATGISHHTHRRRNARRSAG